MNALRVGFLVVADGLALVMLVSLLAGCVATPARYRNGDFISNMASTEAVSRDVPTARPVALPVENPAQVGRNSRAGAVAG